MITPQWNVGGGIKHFQNLVRYFRETKEFYDTSHKLFNYVYDSIFGLMFNGGRVCLPTDTVALNTLVDIIEDYNNLGVGFNWSFTNLLLTEEDMKDEYCNFALQLTSQNSLNGVILTSPILRDHVRKNYPKLRVIYSVCNGLKTVDEYKAALDENDIVVLHPDFNHDYNFLKQLPEKERIEVMVNDVCSFGCPFREQHYRQLSLCNKVQAHNPIIHDMSELDYGRKNCLAIMAGYVKDNRNRLSFSDIDMCLDLGFRHFKLIGREHDWEYYVNNDLTPNLVKYWARKLVKESNQHLHI